MTNTIRKLLSCWPTISSFFDVKSEKKNPVKKHANYLGRVRFFFGLVLTFPGFLQAGRIEAVSCPNTPKIS
jgi:hypothetical protein